VVNGCFGDWVGGVSRVGAGAFVVVGARLILNRVKNDKADELTALLVFA
jgi:hypothetical protein